MGGHPAPPHPFILQNCVLSSGILNTRIVRWVEEKFILSESQAGFRKGRSTVDHILVLKTILDKFLTRKKGRFYCLLSISRRHLTVLTEIALFIHSLKTVRMERC